MNMNMKSKKQIGPFSLLLVFLGMASILASVGVVGKNPIKKGSILQSSLVATNLSLDPLISHHSPAVSPGNREILPAPEMVTWEVEVLGRDMLEGKEVEILEFYPTILAQWRTHPGGKAYRTVETGTIVALQNRVSFAGNVRNRFLVRSDETERTFQELPLNTLEEKM